MRNSRKCEIMCFRRLADRGKRLSHCSHLCGFLTSSLSEYFKRFWTNKKTHPHGFFCGGTLSTCSCIDFRIFRIETTSFCLQDAKQGADCASISVESCPMPRNQHPWIHWIRNQNRDQILLPPLYLNPRPTSNHHRSYQLRSWPSMHLLFGASKMWMILQLACGENGTWQWQSSKSIALSEF